MEEEEVAIPAVEAPIVVAEPEPVVIAEPEPVVIAEPEPVAIAEPEPVVVAEPEPVVVAEPVVKQEPEPVAIASPVLEVKKEVAVPAPASPPTKPRHNNPMTTPERPSNNRLQFTTPSASTPGRASGIESPYKQQVRSGLSPIPKQYAYKGPQQVYTPNRVGKAKNAVEKKKVDLEQQKQRAGVQNQVMKSAVEQYTEYSKDREQALTQANSDLLNARQLDSQYRKDISSFHGKLRVESLKEYEANSAQEAVVKQAQVDQLTSEMLALRVDEKNVRATRLEKELTSRRSAIKQFETEEQKIRASAGKSKGDAAVDKWVIKRREQALAAKSVAANKRRSEAEAANKAAIAKAGKTRQAEAVQEEKNAAQRFQSERSARKGVDTKKALQQTPVKIKQGLDKTKARAAMQAEERMREIDLFHDDRSVKKTHEESERVQNEQDMKARVEERTALLRSRVDKQRQEREVLVSKVKVVKKKK